MHQSRGPDRTLVLFRRHIPDGYDDEFPHDAPAHHYVRLYRGALRHPDLTLHRQTLHRPHQTPIPGYQKPAPTGPLQGIQGIVV